MCIHKGIMVYNLSNYTGNHHLGYYLCFRDGSQGGSGLGQDIGSPGSDKDDLSEDGGLVQTKIEPQEINTTQAHSIYTDLQKAMPSGPYSGLIPNSSMTHSAVSNGSSVDHHSDMLDSYQTL